MPHYGGQGVTVGAETVAVTACQSRAFRSVGSQLALLLSPAKQPKPATEKEARSASHPDASLTERSWTGPLGGADSGSRCVATAAAQLKIRSRASVKS